MATFFIAQKGFGSQLIHREFLDGGKVIDVSGVQRSRHHATVSSIQITGDKYGEIRIVSPTDGSTRIWELYNRNLRVRYSMPLKGKFLRMQIERRELNGFRRAEYHLSRDGSHYILAFQRFESFRVHYMQQGSQGLADSSVCRMPQPQAGSSLKSTVDALLDPQVMLESSAMIDSSCRQPPFQASWEALFSGVKQVIASGNASTASNETTASPTHSQDPSSNRFLSCMQEHKLTYYATRLDQELKTMLGQKDASVFCTDTGNGLFGSENDDKQQIDFDKPWEYVVGTPSSQWNDPESYFADVFFHEALHRSGLEDESVTDGIVKCCGSGNAYGSEGQCKDIENLVADTNYRNAHLRAFDDKLEGFEDFWSLVEKNGDESRVNTFFTDFIEQMKVTRDPSKPNGYQQCMKQKGSVEKDCAQAAIARVNAHVSSYFDQSCPVLFKDKNTKDRPNDAQKLCDLLKGKALNIVQVNATKSCAPGSAATFAGSCLAAAMKESNQLMKDSMNDGGIIEAPQIKVTIQSDDQSLADRKKVLDSYLTALSKYLPGIEPFWEKLKDVAEPLRAEDMIMTLLGTIRTAPNQLSQGFLKCMGQDSLSDSSERASLCARMGRDKVQSFISHYFTDKCPTYFTESENEKKPCETIGKSLSKILDESMSGECDLAQEGYSQVGVPGMDLTCIAQALKEGEENVQNYAALSKAGKLMNSEQHPWFDASYEEKRKEAQKVAQEGSAHAQFFDPSVSARHQAAVDASMPSGGPVMDPAEAARHSGRSANSNSSSETVYSFDPASEQGIDHLKQQIVARSSVSQQLLAGAEKAISSLGVPEAQAEARPASTGNDRVTDQQSRYSAANRSFRGGNSDAASSNELWKTRKSQQASHDRLTQAGNTSVASNGRQGNVAGSVRQANPLSSRNDAGPGGAASGRSAAWSGSASSTSSGASIPSGNRNPQETSPVRAPPQARGNVNSQGMRRKAGIGKPVLTAAQRRMRSQEKLLERFKAQPLKMLPILRGKELSKALIKNRIRAKDDRGRWHGSEHPEVRIWFDAAYHRFAGFPDP